MIFYLGQTVYHRDVYEHREPLEVVGIPKRTREPLPLPKLELKPCPIT